MNREIHTNCPDESVLEKIAAGVCPAELETATLQHAALCDVCGPRLRRYVKIFSPSPLSDSETAQLSQLQTSRPERQREWVRKNVISPAQNDAKAQVQVPLVPWWRKLADAAFKPLSLAPGRMVMAGAAIAVVVLAALEGPNIAKSIQIHSAQNDVGVVFAERRTTVARITSTGYGPLKPFPTELGGESESERGSKIPAYFAVKKAVAENLRDNADPHWFQIAGRMYLWEATPSSLEKAKNAFEKARDKGLDDPSLEIDLAASYFELDNMAEHPNLQRSLSLLHEVLARPKLSNQERATALYDLAVIYEKTQAWDLAVLTWQDYLKVDSTSPWAGEAREHLKDAESKIPEKRKQGYDKPSYFLDQFARHNLTPEDTEQYQQKALSLWLPRAEAHPGNEDWQAVHNLAKALVEHDDFWWKDFLDAWRPGDRPAMLELNAAIAANENGHYDEALTHSQNAAYVFSRNKNAPGDLRARFEEVYALRNQFGGECLDRAGPLVDELTSRKYRWLLGQLYLERAQCRTFQGEFAESEIDAQSGRSVAQRFGFPVLDLRIQGITASLNLQQGKCDKAWEQSTQGLERYWKGSYPGQRLIQFYAAMWQCAEESGSLFTAEALLRHTLAIRKPSGIENPYKEAMLRLRLRNMLMAQRQDAQAKAEDAKASSLLASIPPAARSRIDPKEYRLISDIEPAELQLQQGDPERALATLKPVGETIKGIHDDFISVSYYRVLGNVYLQLKRLEEAEEAYQKAVELAETAMNTLKGGEERLAWLKQTDEVYRGQVRVLLEQRKIEQALDRWEWYQSRPLFQGAREQKLLVKAAPVTMSPATTETRLVYANFKDGMQIWVSNSSGVHGQWKSVRQKDLERAVRDFVERCATPESSLEEVSERGSWLYSILLEPVISELAPSQTVVVELDRSANNLSLESLMSPDGQYFGEKYPVSYSPGMRMEQSLRLPGRLGAQERLALLDASHAPGAGYLPGMQDQRNNIPQFFPRTRIIDSSVMSWKEARVGLAASDVLHYMGHGRPNGSGTSLDYSKNQSLRATDFSPELLGHSQLIVLAACSSALGKDNGLWDSNSLVHAFLAAGVPRVIASHWNVDSDTTSRLMINFYRNVASNEPVVQAVYEARKDILRSNRHPYYWAGFSLTGRVN